MPRMDADNNTPKFKKRKHRPWNVDLLEKTVQESASTIETKNPTAVPSLQENTIKSLSIPTEQDTDTRFDPHALAKVLDKTIEEKTKEKDSLLKKLSKKENARILIGGFFHPGEDLYSKEGASNQQLANQFCALKQKEEELKQLTQHLQTTKALTQVDKLGQENEMILKDKQDLEQNFAFIQQQFEQVQLDLSTTEANLKETRETKNKMHEAQQALEKQLQASFKEIQALTQAKEDLEKNRRQLEHAHLKDKENINTLELTNTHAKEHRIKLEQKILTQEQELKEADIQRHQLVDLKAEVDKLNLRLETEQHHNKELQLQLERAKKTGDALHHQNTILVQEKEQIKRQYTDAHAAHMVMNEKLAKLLDKISEIEADRQSETATKERLQLELENTSTQLRDLETKQEQASKLKRELEGQLQHHEARTKQLESALMHEKTLQHKAQQQLDDMEQKFTKLEYIVKSEQQLRKLAEQRAADLQKEREIETDKAKQAVSQAKQALLAYLENDAPEQKETL